MTASRRKILFALFFASGFCGLLYQVVWTRLAFAAFGIITPVLSVVLSVFMLGLSLGSWAAGKWVGPMTNRWRVPPLILYGVAEMVIGVGAFVVPRLFDAGTHWLLGMGEANSIRYLFFSALVLAGSIVPWCLFMGATFPLMMAYIRADDPRNERGFSSLYLANVLGAAAGTLITAAVLIEMLGFRHTLWVAAAGNFGIAAVSVWLQAQQRGRLSAATTIPISAASNAAGSGKTMSNSLLLSILFYTGFASMAMEVVWIRAFTPVIKTQVYSFAMVVAMYLVATALGSFLYRRSLARKSTRSASELLIFAAAATLLPVLVNDPRWVKANWLYAADPPSMMIVLLSIAPFCAVLGYLTPSLLDQYSAGSPGPAGRAYAVNVLGGILGPLAAGYLMLPNLSENWALILFALPFFPFYFVCSRREAAPMRRLGLGMAAAAMVWALFFANSYEQRVRKVEAHPTIRRDYAASVYSYGEGFYRLLCVNGLGMTTLTPTTKFMVHLPLAWHRGKPESALIICFGMGTSFRSALSWDIDTTAVELVPSVPAAFGFFHDDAAKVRQNPKGRVVIDDGRRFLSRTQEKFDLIVIDPPPPMEAAGSSLLYSKEFYDLAKLHLKTNGILQAWYPGSEDIRSGRAVFRSVYESFPYVLCFDGIDGYGTHILASMSPFETMDAEALAARLPANARKDLLEWSPTQDAATYLNYVLAKKGPIENLLDPNPAVRITDDRPFNEYFLLRRSEGF